VGSADAASVHIGDVRGSMYLFVVVVCAGLNESAAARRVFLPAAAAARRPAVTGSGVGRGGGASKQRIQDFQPSLRRLGHVSNDLII